MMDQPVEVAHYNDAQGNIIYAICACEVTGTADVAIYGRPGEGVISRSPEFPDIEDATTWIHERLPLSSRSPVPDSDLVATTDIEICDTSQANTRLLTQCCRAYDTYWDNVHICRACHAPNPIMLTFK